MPGFNRAITRMKLTPRIKRSFVRPDGPNGLLAKISESRPNHEIGRIGSPPTKDRRTPVRGIFLPPIAGWGVECQRQKLFVAPTPPPLLSFSSRKYRTRI